MTTAIVAPAIISSTVQEEVYQAVYDIWALPDGSSNFHLATSLCLSNDDHVQVVKFGTTENRVLSVAVTMAKNVARRGRWRLHLKYEWEFEGDLWHSELHGHALKDGNKSIDARVRGKYNSRTGKGELYVLEHVQPKPIVEVLLWVQMYQRILSGKIVLEVRWKNPNNHALLRARLKRVEWESQNSLVFLLHSKFYAFEQGEWVGLGKDFFSVEITGNEAPPLMLADERILFSTSDYDFTVYPPGFDVACP